MKSELMRTFYVSEFRIAFLRMLIICKGLYIVNVNQVNYGVV